MEDAGKAVLAGCSTWAHSAGVQFDTKCVVMFAKYVYVIIEEEVTLPESYSARQGTLQ
jgi:hypothetical protein